MQDFSVGELHYEEIARGGCDDFRKESDEERASCPFRYNPSGGTSYESGKEEGSYVEQEHPQGEADEAAGEALPYERTIVNTVANWSTTCAMMFHI